MYGNRARVNISLCVGIGVTVSVSSNKKKNMEKVYCFGKFSFQPREENFQGRV